MKEGPALLVDLYELTMAQCYFRGRKNTVATFELFARQLPRNRNYLVFAGLDDIVEFARSLKFAPADLKYLESLGMFSRPFLRFLEGLRFTGDIWAMAEGSVYFPNEPVVRVTAPIIEAQLLESFFLNAVNLQSMIASKASRVVEAARGRPVHDFSLRRTHGSDAGIKAARSAYLAGFSGTSNVLAGKLYGIPLSGTMAHSFVMSFPDEREAFAVYSREFPDRTTLLVDTYDVRSGIENAVKTGLALQKNGHQLSGIRLDSGDIVSLSKMARKMLDKAGLRRVKVFATGNLDEFRIEEIIDNGGCVDSFGVGTQMGTSADAPSLDVIYKLSGISGKSGEFLPTMKLSANKFTYPGKKQVFRIKDDKGRSVRDIIALENEKVPGSPLLTKVVAGGKRAGRPAGLESSRVLLRAQIAGLPPALRSSRSAKAAFPVEIGPGLRALTASLARKLRTRRSGSERRGF